jgi:hypothetical protein
MELVDGGTLEEKVTRQGPLSVAEAVRDILEVIDVLEAAHRGGVLHRDIKPANCFVTLFGTVKLGDFGLSRPIEAADQLRPTQTGVFIGTPVFSAPEQLLGEQLDARADLYAVAVTLYYLLTGQLPYESDNAMRLIAVVVSGNAIPVLSRRPDLPPGLAAVIMKGLSRSRNDRHVDCEALGRDLAPFGPLAAEPAPLGRRFPAGVVDSFGLMVLSAPLVSLVGASIASNSDLSSGQELSMTLLQLPLYAAWYGVLEGRYGWSPGKLLAKMRVVRADGSPLGVRRGVLRALLIWALALLGVAAYALGSGSLAKSLAQIAITYGVTALLFARARRNNGFAAEHDHLTDSRVVRHFVGSSVNRTVTSRTMPVAVSNDRLRVGTDVLVDELGPIPGVNVGYDREMGRRVWLARRASGQPPIAEATRGAARVGCLRWLGSEVSGEGDWDVYAAVEGESLRSRLERPADWATVQQWISGIAQEEIARSATSWPSEQLSTANVWITCADDAVIVPFRVDSEAESASPREPPSCSKSPR